MTTSSVFTFSFLTSKIAVAKQSGSYQALLKSCSSLQCTSKAFAMERYSSLSKYFGSRMGNSLSNHSMVPELYLISMPLFARKSALQVPCAVRSLGSCLAPAIVLLGGQMVLHSRILWEVSLFLFNRLIAVSCWASASSSASVNGKASLTEILRSPLSLKDYKK